MSILKTILKLAAPLPDLTGFERFLFLGPHPDDIEIGAGATAAKFAAEGKTVCFLICMDGRFGTDELRESLTPEELAKIRQWEAQDSAALLGVKDVRFLDFCDGGFYADEDILTAVAQVIGDFKPDVIFAPDPDVRSECHPDHRVVGAVGRELALFSGNPGIMARYGTQASPVQALALYMTAKANRFVGTDGYLEKQLSAIFDCHKSQFPDGCASAKAIRLYLRLRAANFGLRSLRRTAEGFRVLGRTQMHCLPEAD
jgi:LmbE family N-acetylglucosaminyl deacetylase